MRSLDLSDIGAHFYMGLDTIWLGQLLDEAGELVAKIAIVPHRGFEVEDEPAELGDGRVEALDGFFQMVAVARVVDP